MSINKGKEGKIVIHKEQNIYDSSNDVLNAYLSNGVETAYKGWKTTDFILLESNLFVVDVQATINGQYCAYYDEDKNFISAAQSFGNTIFNDNRLSINVKPNNAKYIRLSGNDSYFSGLKIYYVEPIEINIIT